MDLCDFCVINKYRLLQSASWNKNLDSQSRLIVFFKRNIFFSPVFSSKDRQTTVYTQIFIPGTMSIYFTGPAL